VAPITSNPQAPLARNGSGQLIGGFGVINALFAATTVPTAAALLPRTATIVARVTF